MTPSRRLRNVAVAVVPLALAALPSLPNATGAAKFPSKGTGGITWSASVPTDPQRDVGEPEIHIDLAGNIYTCGPSGFSNVADYMQISTDGGDQFHLLGQPPRGQISGGEGGGDCGLATGTDKNAQGNYTLAYSGLGPLTNFSTFTSKDNGHTITPSPISESPPGVDRQWHVFTGPETVFLNYNRLGVGYTVQKSTDGGLTYGPAIDTGAGGGRIGPLRAVLSPDRDPDKAIVYFPSYNGSQITVTRSVDGGDTWGTCNVIDSEMNPSAGFILADHDSKGNVYITWSEKGGEHDTWLTVLPAANLAKCEGDDDTLGTGRMIRVNRDDVETTVMPWIVAGDEGRVAVTFFGTKSAGEPDDGSFVASWYPYVSMSLNALSPNPTWFQTASTTHPFHYGSICLGGLGCDLSVPEGDRSLADYFAMDMDPNTGRLHVVYGSAAKKPTDSVGHVSTATVVSQESGPSLLAAKDITPRRPVLRQQSADAAGDALAPYSQLYVKPNPQNVAALDILDVQVGSDADNVTVTMKLAGLGDGDLRSALTATGSQSLVWLFRFLNGFQPAGATAAWSPATGFTFGFDDFTTKSTESGQADPTAEKIIVWPQSVSIDGDANQDAGTITLTFPRNLLKAQVGPTGPGQVPELAEATDGSRFFDATVFSMGNAFSPVQDVQSYLYQVDSSPAMDFQVGAAKKGKKGGSGGSGSVEEREEEGREEAREEEAREERTAPRTIPTTGASGAAGLAAIAMLGAAIAVTWRRRRAAGQFEL